MDDAFKQLAGYSPADPVGKIALGFLVFCVVGIYCALVWGTWTGRI